MELQGLISVTFLFIAVFQVTSIVGLPAEWTGEAEKDHKISITLVRKKRDTEDNSEGNSNGGYQMKVSAFDADYNADLVKPSSSIFSPGFKFQLLDNENGANKLEDITPSRQEIKEIENGHFIDPTLGAAVSVTSFSGGVTPRVRGIIGNIAITPNADNNHTATKRSDAEASFSDYIDLHRNVTPGVTLTRAAVVAQPEVFVIFDNANYKTFNGNTKDIIDYLAVFFHGINNRYDTISDPKITFKISGITAVSSTSGEPFMENNKTPDGTGNDINKVLDSYAKWVYENRNTIPKHDIATVISGRDFKAKDSKGAYVSNVAGLAYLKAACWVDSAGGRSWATSVGEDIGGYYDGIFTMAHEFAHNLAAPHDGSGGAASCSWDDGYLMSYNGWGTKNKFLFSQCSVSLMKDFIQSSGGTCLKTIQNTNGIAVSKDNPGDRLDMTALCKKYSKQAAAVVDSSKTPSQLCKNLVCKYPAPGKPAGWTTTLTLNHPPGDNSPCGTGGRCINGECVVSGSG